MVIRLLLMKLERLLSIIFNLLNQEIVSASSLAKEFQVLCRTIYRNIEAIYQSFLSKGQTAVSGL